LQGLFDIFFTTRENIGKNNGEWQGRALIAIFCGQGHGRMVTQWGQTASFKEQKQNSPAGAARSGKPPE